MLIYKINIFLIFLIFNLQVLGKAFNDNYTEAITISFQTDNAFSKNEKYFIEPNNSLTKIRRDGEIGYSTLRPNGDFNFSFLPFLIDYNGLPEKDLILSIKYRDDLIEWDKSQKEIDGHVVIESRLDFTEKNQYYEIGHLEFTGDSKWKTKTIFVAKTPWQMIRVVDGAFRFRIKHIGKTKKHIPISEISIRSKEKNIFYKLLDEDRINRGWGFKRLDFNDGKLTEQNIVDENKFITYPVNYLKPIYENSVIDANNIDKPLICFEIPGQNEPLSFVIHGINDINGLSLNVTDLKHDNNTIFKNNITINRVVYNDQRWGWTTERNYGACPDYLVLYKPSFNIDKGKNIQFWLNIKIPENTPKGDYVGRVEILREGSVVKSLQICVEVLDIQLVRNEKEHLVFHSPYLRKFHSDPIKILYDMKEHGLVPIWYPPRRLIKRQERVDLQLDEFDNQLKAFKDIFPESKRLFVVLFDFYEAWNAVDSSKDYFSHYNIKYEKVYEKFLKRYSEIAGNYDLELYFSFRDEPFKRVDARRISYTCSDIAKNIHFKTWSTHRIDYDVQLYSSDGYNENLRPLKDVLDVFFEPVKYITENNVYKFNKLNTELSYYTTNFATSVRPVYNRFLHGIYPFATNSDYVLVYAYRDFSVDPYDDTDSKANFPYQIGMNDYLLTYPSWSGEILPTLSYEALREGVEDSALISTLRFLAKKALSDYDNMKKEKGEESLIYLDTLLKKASMNFEQRYYTHYKAQPLDPMPGEILKSIGGKNHDDYCVFDVIRRNICDRIVDLQ